MSHRRGHLIVVLDVSIAGKVSGYVGTVQTQSHPGYNLRFPVLDMVLISHHASTS